MILVTGATGLVGGHLLWYLLQQRENIVAIKRKTSNLNALRTVFSFYTDTPDVYLNRVKWRIADIVDMQSVKEAMSGITEIYHCAAHVSLGKGSKTLMDTNISGTRNMLEVALELGVKKFCFVSSIAACGFAHGDHIITEDSTWSESVHKSLYAISKYKAEQEVWKAVGKGLNAVIVNPGVILGVSGTKTGSSLLFERSRKGMLFYTQGGSGYVDVQDVVKIMFRLMENNIMGKRFILVSENNSNKEILSMMATGFHRARPVFKVGRRLLMLVGLFFELTGKLFGFTPVIDRSFAVSLTNRSYYSSQKVIDMLGGYRFKPISACIREVCAFISKHSS